MRPELSVVIPTLNGELHLPAQLEALAQQVCVRDWEVIVVDNGSTDATSTIASSFRNALPRLSLVDAPERGRTHALNAGVAAASGRFIVCVDCDDVVDRGYVEAMRRALVESDLVGGRLEYRLLNPPWAIVSAVQTTSLMRIGPHLFSSGAALAFRRGVYETLGGFAADVGSAQDLDLCWRAQMADYRLAFASDAILHYRHRLGWRQQFARGMSYGRGRSLLQRKYGADAAPSSNRRSRLRAIASHTVHATDRLRRQQLAHLAGWLVGYHTRGSGVFAERMVLLLDGTGPRVTPIRASRAIQR